MPRVKKKNPRYNVVSIRLSEEESKHLESLIGTTHKCVSHFMRDALNYFVALHERALSE